LQEYPKKLRSVIYAKVDAFQMSQELYDKVMNEWNKHKASLKVKPNKKEQAEESEPQMAAESETTTETDAEMRENIQEANEEAAAAGE